jgi:hypothetical protein
MSFPTKENPKDCQNTCGVKIYLSKQSGRYLPYELDGNLHQCPKRKQETFDHSNGNNDLRLEVMLLLKKLASIGITIDLNKLRNVK